MTQAAKYRSQSMQELQDELLRLKREQLNNRILMRVGNFANTSEFKSNRRDIARVKTIIKEKQDAN